MCFLLIAPSVLCWTLALRDIASIPSVRFRRSTPRFAYFDVTSLTALHFGNPTDASLAADLCARIRTAPSHQQAQKNHSHRPFYRESQTFSSSISAFDRTMHQSTVASAGTLLIMVFQWYIIVVLCAKITYYTIRI